MNFHSRRPTNYKKTKKEMERKKGLFLPIKQMLEEKARQNKAKEMKELSIEKKYI